MNIEIRHRYVRLGRGKIGSKRASINGDLYVIVVDGKRVDSFLEFKNAKRKVEQLCEANRSVIQGN